MAAPLNLDLQPLSFDEIEWNLDFDLVPHVSPVPKIIDIELIPTGDRAVLSHPETDS